MLERWNPYGRMRRMDEIMDRMWAPFGDTTAGNAVESWTMSVDIVEQDDNILVTATIPGVNQDDLDVTVLDGVLIIKGHTCEAHEEDTGKYIMRERRTGTFYRSVRLPVAVDEDQAESKLEGGILTISFPKVEDEKPRKIPVSVVN